MMKTLCFTVGLLLLVVCCCNAALEAVQNSNGSPKCCSEFSSGPVPLKKVIGISKTSATCLLRAFIVQTIKGKQFCYRQTFKWAQKLYNQRSTEGRNQKH